VFEDKQNEPCAKKTSFKIAIFFETGNIVDMFFEASTIPTIFALWLFDFI